MSRVGVVRFLGTNCDRDVAQWAQERHHEVEFIWYHDKQELKRFDYVILPGGFSFGDYLRSGAVAARSPIMSSLRDYVQFGGSVLGICNGFQILCEAGLLPGVLLKNTQGEFIDRWVDLEMVRAQTRFTQVSRTLRLPVAHGDGRYHADDETLKSLQDKGQIWLRYNENINGSVDRIAGICSENGRICGLMPHPERAIYEWMGSKDGECFL